MARKSRIEFPGAVYHVINRGSRREVIFRQDADRELFLRTPKEACARTGWCVHAYVLMGNHFYLLLETPHGLLSRGMHWLQTTYTSRFNRRYRLSGHVFQGRFKATVIDPEEAGHFATVADYIHLNPVRAGLIDLRSEQLDDYSWSSLVEYRAAPRGRAPWLMVERVLGEHGYADRSNHRRSYMRDLTARALDQQGGTAAQRERIWRGWYLGSAEFRDRLLEKLENVTGKRRVSAGATEVGADHAEWQAERLERAGLGHFALSDRELRSVRKSDARKVVIARLIKAQTVSLRWISGRLHMGAQSHVSRLCSRPSTVSERNSTKQIMSRVKT